MTFLNPFYATVYGFLPDALAVTAGTLLLWTIGIVIGVIPKYGIYLKYGVYALIIVNTVFGVISFFIGSSDVGSFNDIVGVGITNSVFLIIMALGLIFFFKVKLTNKYLGWIFGYYGFWLGYFIAMLIMSINDPAITPYSWILIGWIASVQILLVTIVKMYEKRKVLPQTIYVKDM